MKKNLYDVLNLKQSATFEEIKEAYQKAKSSLSEENMALYSIMSSNDIEDNVNEIEEAYAVLGNENNRRKYHLENNIFVEEKTSDKKAEKEEKVTISLKEEIKVAPVKAKTEKKISNLVASNKFALKMMSTLFLKKKLQN
jgi:curved DNA-binding protein CbpA